MVNILDLKSFCCVVMRLEQPGNRIGYRAQKLMLNMHAGKSCRISRDIADLHRDCFTRFGWPADMLA